MTKEETQEHMQRLAEDFGLPLKEVYTLALFLGPDEYQDGLVTACEDRGLELEREERRRLSYPTEPGRLY